MTRNYALYVHELDNIKEYITCNKKDFKNVHIYHNKEMYKYTKNAIYFTFKKFELSLK